jgi:hypothetical protein
MRLLNTSTIQFEEFPGDDIPHYAILSHTWGEEEVSFQDMQNGHGQDKAGLVKIKSCCALAALDGWEYAWIDTCCIDKKSSAELSEAINSMFEWYRRAAVCYAYLVDVPDAEANHDRINSAFRRSRWFTRGWTLQELLAPEVVIFYDRDWKEIGTKLSLSRVISAITGIRPSDMVQYGNVNVAVKMSWASKRQTTRIEDIAYCLMGLFGVQMPLLYGEGKNAFLRLQLEILKVSDDETIFAWDDETFFKQEWELRGTGLLASSPARFRRSGDIRQIPFDVNRPVYSMTNKGLRMELLLWRETEFENHPHYKGNGINIYLAPLNCTRHPEGHPIAIYLRTGTQNIADVGADFTRGFPRGPKLATVDMDFPSPTLKDEGRKIVNVKQVDIGRARSVPTIQTHLLMIRYPPVLGQILLANRFSLTGAKEIRAVELPDTNGLRHKRVPEEARFDRFTPDTGYGVMFAGTNNEGLGNCAVLACRSMDGNMADIVVMDGTQTLREIVTLFNQQAVDEGQGSDRISRHLRAGSSVSVALRFVGLQEKSTAPGFVLDITIDAKARPRWPAPERTFIQVGSVTQEVMAFMEGMKKLKKEASFEGE